MHANSFDFAPPEKHPDVIAHTRVVDFFTRFGLLHQNLETLAVRTYERLSRKGHLLDETQVRSMYAPETNLFLMR